MVFLTICQDTEIVHQLSRTHPIHRLHIDHVAIAFLVLEAVHQMLGLWACNTQTGCLVSHDLLVPFVCNRVMVGSVI